MIAWLLTSWPAQVALLVVAVWFARGVYVAIQRPWIKYLSHTRVPGNGTLITIDRQELLPPWRLQRETWLLDDSTDGGLDKLRKPVREGDGRIEQSSYGRHTVLGAQLYGLLEICRVRDAELKGYTDEPMR